MSTNLISNILLYSSLLIAITSYAVMGIGYYREHKYKSAQTAQAKLNNKVFIGFGGLFGLIFTFFVLALYWISLSQV